MEPHDIRNVGGGTLRVLGFFSAPTLVATFDEPVAPGGPQVFVIGAPDRDRGPARGVGARLGRDQRARKEGTPPIPSFP